MMYVGEAEMYFGAAHDIKQAAIESSVVTSIIVVYQLAILTFRRGRKYMFCIIKSPVKNFWYANWRSDKVLIRLTFYTVYYIHKSFLI